MTSLCIHGFRSDECASCRECPHGLAVSRCSRCRAAATAASRRRVVPATPPDTDTATYNGFEIVFTPSVNGWQYRAPDAPLSRESYRSAFLARKAIDTLGSAPVAEASRPSKRRK